MERLVNLLPDSTFIGKTKLAFGNDSLVHACQMTEAIANEIFRVLTAFADTDQVCDLRDATRNLAVLGRFLTVSYNTIFEQNA